MDDRTPVGWMVVVAALVLQVASRSMDSDAARIMVSGASAVLAVGGLVLVWRARKPPPKPRTAADPEGPAESDPPDDPAV